MQEMRLNEADYLFETSWEICNKVGGIHTVISTKASSMVEKYKDNYLLIGPDVWKETHENPEFSQDPDLYRNWREKALQDGINIRLGRWNISGKPLVILVDFTPLFSKKNEIFAYFWEKHRLDSLSGQWDYVEPALFGYAAARVIESFYNYYLSAHDKIITHFHEWMTGTGILYLKKKVPQAGTAFTTHATILGRSIAGNNFPLYQKIKEFDPDKISRDFGIVSKYSLEKLSAKEADVFTTVSEITAQECKYFLKKEIDIVTPNGFDDSFVPQADDFLKKRQNARAILKEVAQEVLSHEISDDAVFVINSGRYEFSNKGIDLFLDALEKLNQRNIQGEIVAFLTIPANHSGPIKHNVSADHVPENHDNNLDRFITHGLYEKEKDPILTKIKNSNLKNLPGDKVKVIFVPCYLNGNDGIFNTSYYDLLIGFDISVFPSYYEPWGYTPLESIAFHIPTITTTLAGFGLWVKDHYKKENISVKVISRTDDNKEFVIKEIADSLNNFLTSSNEERNRIRKNAYEISRIALWKEFAENYHKAHAIALDKVFERADLYQNKNAPEVLSYRRKKSSDNQVLWKKILIKPGIPDRLKSLLKLSKNLWWSWTPEAKNLFEMIEPRLWEKFHRNPIPLIEALSIDQFKALEKNEEFLAKLDFVCQKFDKYMSVPKSNPEIAYFSMEFGLHDSLKIFSGGLGVLAGDYLKEASDTNTNIVAIGLLYRYGYFHQKISILGDQLSQLIPQKFTHLPLEPVRDKKGIWVSISLALPGRRLYAKAWKVNVGRVVLYLLDADIEENRPEDRSITHQLYGGNWENRFKQELLLGIGGIRLLNTLNYKPDLFHCNEGHAAFTGIERLRGFIQQKKFSFTHAMEIVRATSLFTTHTPVPAGHDSFHEDLMRTYIPHYAGHLNISWDDFMNLGRAEENNPNEKFSLSILAAKLSQEMNGVSKIHGRVTREMFLKLYNGFYPNELHISYVTNGVHLPTWLNDKWRELYSKYIDNDFINNQHDFKKWHNIYEVKDHLIWSIKQELRKELLDYIKERLETSLTERQEDPRIIFQQITHLNNQTLTFGFARRFATYKRAHLLFTNPDRLAKLVNEPDKPVQFLFAGKAHPQDKAGQDLIKKIIEISRKTEFIGKILFIENYDMELASKMVQGCDVWLNTPTRPLEASGTSGEKAVMNGVLNCSVLDGWWAEGYIPGAGWALKEDKTYNNQSIQDKLDAETLYNIIENQIKTLFYTKNEDDIPHNWVQYMKKNIAEIAPQFTMNRMINDYKNNYYLKMYERSSSLQKNNYEQAREIAGWKSKISRIWDDIEISEIFYPDSTSRPLKLGEDFETKIVLKNTSGLQPEDLGVEILFGQKEHDSVEKIIHQEELQLSERTKNTMTFSTRIPANRAGVYDFVFRLFPKHPLLPHRQDFNLIRWI